MLEKKYTINPLMRIRWNNQQGSGDNTVFENTETGHKFFINDPVFDVISQLKESKTKKELVHYLQKKNNESPMSQEKIISELIQKKALVTENERVKYSSWFEHSWRNALYFHLLSRKSELVETIGNSGSKKNGIVNQSKIVPSKTNNTLKLPKPQKIKTTIYEALFNRRTTRVFSRKKITLKDLSTILFYASYLTKQEKMNIDRKGLVIDILVHPKIYLEISNVDRLPNGIYFYDVNEHRLFKIRSGTYSKKIQRIAIGQKAAALAASNFIVASPFKQYMQKYQDKQAYRKLLIEASALGQRIILAAECLGIKSFLTPAMKDSEMDNLLKIDGFNEGATYLISCGFPVKK